MAMPYLGKYGSLWRISFGEVSAYFVVKRIANGFFAGGLAGIICLYVVMHRLCIYCFLKFRPFLRSSSFKMGMEVFPIPCKLIISSSVNPASFLIVKMSVLARARRAGA